MTDKLKSRGKLAALLLLAATAAAIAAVPGLRQAQATIPGPVTPATAGQGHRVEVVFVLDTTSSMSGLIQAAKEKIWSIATTMASARQQPEVRMGLVAFRDRGDAYVTRVFDLSADLDSMYAQLMELRAEGGGDGPESVNEALYAAIQGISWSQGDDVYRVAFLVGDAPPHMDYPDDVKYPETLAAAQRKGIVVNTIQSGHHGVTRPAWEQIAALGGGHYFAVEDSGNAVAVTTPFDEQLAKMAAALDGTRLFFGDAGERAVAEARVEAGRKLEEELSAAALARRATFYAMPSAKSNFLGNSELVDAITSGAIELEEIVAEDLPASLQALAPDEARAVIEEKAQQRERLQRQIRSLSESRERFIQERLDAEGGADDSLDEQIYRTVREQATGAGLRYDRDTARY